MWQAGNVLYIIIYLKIYVQTLVAILDSQCLGANINSTGISIIMSCVSGYSGFLKI